MKTFVRKTLFSLLILAIAAMPMLMSPLVVEAAATCKSSAPSSGAYTVTLCITNPASGAVLSGDNTVSATISVSGTNPGVRRVIFYLDKAYVLTDFTSSYLFTLPTAQWKDGSYTLGAQALMRDGFTTSQTTMPISFSNGNSSTPVNTNQFTPTSGTTPGAGAPFLVAAAGDGASGETYSGKVSDMIVSLSPNLFLYLGDVYEKGSVSEFYNWYGTDSTYFGRLRDITDPTIGNHEYEKGVAPGYFNYWDNIPNYYSFDAGGWHFISLNSNSSKIAVSKGSAQYNWLQQDLSANIQTCTIVYYHHPLFNIGPEGPTNAMSDIWNLMAQYGVSIVINGHDHDYQRWVPLDGSGNPSATGITEFVAGGAGHGLQTITKSDSRVAYWNSTNPTAFGVLLLQLTSSKAGFSYRNSSGTILDSGTIQCAKSGIDATAPSIPTGLTATVTTNPDQVDLSWNASNDNVGIAGYTIYRDGASIDTVAGTVTSYSDTSISAGTFSYTVDAFDAAGNHSEQSPASLVTIPDTSAPSVPGGFAASAISSTQVNLNWTASTDDVGVTGYTVYRDGSVLVTVSGTTLSYSDLSVTDSTTYTYSVDAFDAAGNHSAQTSPISITTPAMPSSLTFTPDADAYVNSSYPGTNYGTSTSLRVDASPIVNSYLRFTVQGLSGHTIAKARLLIYAKSSSSQGLTAWAVADNTWVETVITFSNAPAFASSISSTGAVTGSTWMTLDVTSYITGEGTSSIGISTPGSTAISLASRESGSTSPQLIIDLN